MHRFDPQDQMKQKNFFQLHLEKALARLSDSLIFLAFLALCLMAAKMAASKASFRFFCVRAEHSTYSVARIFSARLRARELSTGFTLYRSRSIRTLTSSRRSDWVPTRMMGDVGLHERISGIHFFVMFWKDVGLTTLKQSRKTSVWAYDSERKPSNSSWNTEGAEIRTRRIPLRIILMRRFYMSLSERIILSIIILYIYIYVNEVYCVLCHSTDVKTTQKISHWSHWETRHTGMWTNHPWVSLWYVFRWLDNSLPSIIQKNDIIKEWLKAHETFIWSQFIHNHL